MKKHLLTAGLAALFLAGCTFSVTDENFESETFRAAKKSTGSVQMQTPVIEGKISGPFGDSEFASIAKNAELYGRIDAKSNGKVYYISPKGKDSNKGTSDKPFKTFTKALSKLKAGDTLYVKAGTYYTSKEAEGDNIYISEKYGKSGAYITVAADPANGSSKAIISGNGLDENFALLTLDDCAYIRISGLTFQDSDGQDATGIAIENNSNHVIVDNCEFTDITVPNPAKKDHTANGIRAIGDRDDDDDENYLHNILFYGNYFHDMATGWSECISCPGNVEYVNIINNTIDTTGNIGIDVGGNYNYYKKDPSKDFTRYAYIAKNTVRNEESPYGDTSYGIYADGGQHIIIVNNIVEDCSGGIEVGAEEKPSSEKYSTSDVLVQDNTITNKKYENAYTIQIGGYEASRGWVKNVVIRGNDISVGTSTENAIIEFSKCDGITIENNSFTASNKFEGSTYNCGLSSSEISGNTKNITLKGNTYNNVKKLGSKMKKIKSLKDYE